MDENAALDFVQGRLSGPEVQRIDEHVDGCAGCRVLIGEAVRAFRERVTDGQVAGPAPLTRFVPGDTLAARYKVVRFIARGGMGEVYEVEDMMLGARVALKTLAATISDDPLAIRRLKLEATLARRITHPNVCRIFDLGVHEQPGQRPDEGVLFITMELVPGTSLGQRIRAEGRLACEAALPIVQAMVAAIGAAHAAGIVHRDFKSENVMLAPPVEPGGPPRVVVMDFGLARATSVPTNTSSFDRSLAGTLAYMAPEQLEGKPTGPATDTYALGIVMFEMLTGELPFEGESPLGGAWKRLSQKAPSPRAIVPGIDSLWAAVIARCLEREPGRRPASVEDVARALTAGTLPATIGTRARWLLGVAALGVLAGIGVGMARTRVASMVTTPARAAAPVVATPAAPVALPPAAAVAPPPAGPPPARATPPHELEKAAILVAARKPRAPARPAPHAEHQQASAAAPAPEAAPTGPDAASWRRSDDPDDGFIR